MQANPVDVGSNPTVPNEETKKGHKRMANFNYNKVILGGRLTADPEVKMTQSGTEVVSFTVAVNRPKGKDGEQQSDFITCVAWKERAKFISQYFKKGSSICIEGELQTRKWQDNEGNNRYATEVRVSGAHFVDSKGEGAPTQSQSSYAPSTYVPDAYRPTQQTFAGAALSDDSDLPF